jgi:hypothetical protein
MDRILAFGRMDLFGLPRDFKGIGFAQCLFLGVLRFLLLNLVLPKKLLGLLAGFSPGAVVHPIDHGHVGLFSFRVLIYASKKMKVWHSAHYSRKIPGNKTPTRRRARSP